MLFIIRNKTLLFLFFLASAIWACAAGRIEMSSPSLAPVDRMSEIKAGSTTFSQVLERLGPPDYIIDGTQRIYDISTPYTPPGPLPTRTFSAPEGEVILIYSGFHASVGFAGSIAGTTASLKTGEEMVLIYLSKQDRSVIDVAISGRARKGASE